MLIPKQIKRLGTEGLEITWDDNSISIFNSRVLRDNCPAADSKEKRGEGASHKKPLSQPSGRGLLTVLSSTIEEELKLLKIESIGNYAVRLVWADGHDSGIFSYEYLFELAKNL